VGVCVGCGLTSDSGIVEVKTRPNGGVQCDDNDGIRVSLAEAAVSTFISTSEQTATTFYTDLSTVGPQVSVTTGTVALVFIDTEYFGLDPGDIAHMSVAVSGASFIPALDNYSLRVGDDAVAYQKGMSFTIGGLTPGTNTFTAKYRAERGTAVFAFRRLTVLAIGT
jgi:hypothetical protein